MIDRATLTRIARMKGLVNLDHASKDYFQEIMLLSISREFPHLVFKGGTCLYKFHGLDRFSEDIDLVGQITEKDLDKVSMYMTDFGYRNTIESYTMASGILATFKVRGFLFTGEDVTLTRVRMDATVKDEVLMEPVMRSMRSLYPDIPSFQVLTMDDREILAEKIRSLYQRSKARDLYDLTFLLDLKVVIDPVLIKSKLDPYGIGPDKDYLEVSLDRIESTWTRELKPLLGRVPPFEEMRSKAMSVLDVVNDA